MGGRLVVASVGLLALLCAGCAVGRSPSMAAAPLRLVYTTAGDLEVSLASDPGRRFEAIPLVGDFRTGVDGYDVVGGNALLPIRRPLPELTVGLAPVGAVSANLPGLNSDPLAASATLSGLASASAAAALAAPAPTSVPSALPGASLAVAAAAAGQSPIGVAADLGGGGASATVSTAPLTVAAAVPTTTPVSPALTLQGPVLSAPSPAPPATVATSLAGASVNSLLDPLRRFP